jgi:hypothetical protein
LAGREGEYGGDGSDGDEVGGVDDGDDEGAVLVVVGSGPDYYFSGWNPCGPHHHQNGLGIYETYETNETY